MNILLWITHDEVVRLITLGLLFIFGNLKKQFDREYQAYVKV